MTGCTLCDLDLPADPVTDPEVAGEFCCRGCLAVARSLDDVEEPPELDRLLQVGVRVLVVRLYHVLLGVRAGEDDDGDAFQVGVGLDLAQHLLAALPGEVQVEQDHVRALHVRVLALLPEILHRGDAVVHLVEVVHESGVLERLPRQADVARVVLDEEYIEMYRLSHRYFGGRLTTVRKKSSTLLTMSTKPSKSTGFVR